MFLMHSQLLQPQESLYKVWPQQESALKHVHELLQASVSLKHLVEKPSLVEDQVAAKAAVRGYSMLTQVIQ